MRRALFVLGTVLLTAAAGSASQSPTGAASPVVHHDLVVHLDPAAGTLRVVDDITLPTPPAGGEATATLHGDMIIAAGHKGTAAAADAARPPRQGVVLAAEGGRIHVEYHGRIHHEPETLASDAARSFSTTPGIIDARGVYLASSAAWFPQIHNNALYTYRLEVRGLPPGMRAFASGTEQPTAGGVRFVRQDTVDDIVLVAGPFVETRAEVDGVEVLTLLREKDPALSSRYLDVTRQYLTLYRNLIGPYPYGRFALVENFWETGYGMPEFTLLGPKVIRFPFILHSSYPHELLHNWWGNGVYLPPFGDNWAEGLTAYLADHLVKEMRGQGAMHRRDLLVRYRDHVDADHDFAIRTFTGRRSPASEAVGYGKTTMMFHMLRRRLGDEAFKQGLRTLARDRMFQRTTFADVQRAFERASSQKLDRFFTDWADTVGAPAIGWSGVQAARDPRGTWTATVGLRQGGTPHVYDLDVPVALTLANGDTVYKSVRLDRPAVEARFEVAARPLRADIDPQYDVFRRVYRTEVPPSLSRVLGDQRILFVRPSVSSAEEQKTIAALIKAWCPGRDCAQVTDKSFTGWPPDRAVVVLGYQNLLRGAAVVGAKRFGAILDDVRFELDRRRRLFNAEHSVVLALEHPTTADRGMLFVGAVSPVALGNLARKLPHYGKYSALAFAGDEADNRLKHVWEPVGSPLSVPFSPDGTAAVRGPEDRAPLAELPPPFDGARMLSLVKTLSNPALGGRATGTPGYDRALQAAEAAAPGRTTRQCFAHQQKQACNLIVSLPGKDPGKPRIVLGAHLDHLGKTAAGLHPGANDNASGVAVALEVATQLSREEPGLRPVDVVLFAGEELGRLGATHYVKTVGADQVVAMMNLDVVGQRTGDAFVVLGAESAMEWPHIFRGVTFVTGIKTEIGTAGLDSSDHVSFSTAGVPAVQLFSGPYAAYHKPGDGVGEVNERSLVEAAVITKEVLAYLRDRPAPLTAQGGVNASPARPAPGARPVTFGAVPDFSFRGEGIKLYGVGQDTPAAQAGLQKGDLLVSFGGVKLRNLRQFSFLLRKHQPGDEVEVVAQRGAETLRVRVKLIAP